MPKLKESFWSRIEKKYPGVFKIENRLAFCKICNCTVQSRLKQLQQHLDTNKHKIAENNEDVNLQYDWDISKSFVEANIPLSKLDHPSIQEFLENHIGSAAPNLASLTQRVIPKIYKETLKKLQTIVKNKYIWLAIDEHTHTEDQRLLVNMIFGILDADGVYRNKCYLLNSIMLSNADSSSMGGFFVDSLTLLWPTGIQFQKVMVCITHPHACINGALETIKPIFPKMLHITCFAQGLHQIAERVRANFPKVNGLISATNTLFLMVPYYRYLLKKDFPELNLPPNPSVTHWGTWLKAAIYYSEHYAEIKTFLAKRSESDSIAIGTAKQFFENEDVKKELDFLKHVFFTLAKGAERIEKKGLDIQEIITILESVFSSLNSIEQREYIERLKVSFGRNGYNCLRDIYKGLYEKQSPTEVYVRSLTMAEINLFKYCPVSCYQADRVFPLYETIYKSNCQMKKFENLKKNLIIYCNQTN